MRIGFFSWESLNSIPVGGVAAVVTQLSEALAKLGHEVHVFTRMPAGYPEHELINGVYEHRCVSPHCEDFIEYMDHVGDAMVSCYHWAKREYGGFDVLQGHDWHVVNALSNIKHNTGKEFVWTCHSTEWGRNGNAQNDSWFSARVRHREWLGGYLSKKVTTVSYAMKYELERLYQVPWDKIEVIYNGVNTQDFNIKVDPGRVKEGYGVHPLAPVVLFVGRMCHQKGPDLLLEAIPDVLGFRNDIKFVFVGGGQGMIDHIWGRSKYLGVDWAIRVLGYVPDDVRVEWLKACDVVCMPSRNEPFGIVALEAFAAGKPVVATDIGGPSEIIENFATGVKVYQTPESIAWGLKYVFGDPTGENIKRMGERAKKEAGKYDWEEIAKQYVREYKKI